MYSINGNYYNKVIENFTAGAKYNGQSCNVGTDCRSNFCAAGSGLPKKCYNGASCEDRMVCPSYSRCRNNTITWVNGYTSGDYNASKLCRATGDRQNGLIYRSGTNSGQGIYPIPT